MPFKVLGFPVDNRFIMAFSVLNRTIVHGLVGMSSRMEYLRGIVEYYWRTHSGSVVWKQQQLDSQPAEYGGAAFWMEQYIKKAPPGQNTSSVTFLLGDFFRIFEF
jgi:hypothetical protein